MTDLDALRCDDPPEPRLRRQRQRHGRRHGQLHQQRLERGGLQLQWHLQPDDGRLQRRDLVVHQPQQLAGRGHGAPAAAGTARRWPSITPVRPRFRHGSSGMGICLEQPPQAYVLNSAGAVTICLLPAAWTRRKVAPSNSKGDVAGGPGFTNANSYSAMSPSTPRRLHSHELGTTMAAPAKIRMHTHQRLRNMVVGNATNTNGAFLSVKRPVPFYDPRNAQPDRPAGRHVRPDHLVSPGCRPLGPGQRRGLTTPGQITARRRPLIHRRQ